MSGAGGRAVVPAALAACVLAVAAAAPLATVQDGQRAYDTGQFDRARDIWAPLAADGNIMAEFGLGLMYDLGRGEPQSAEQAYRWYRRAAEAGLAAADFNVGVMLDSGVGVSHDAAEAALWYARAAGWGNRRAQYNLAQLYAAGEGVPRNPDAAAAWYREAAEEIPAAHAKLAELQAARRPNASGAASLVAAIPQAPAAQASVPPATELVWIAPPQPVPVRFFVEVRALEPGGSREVIARYLDTSATLAELEHQTNYAWRVSAVYAGGHHYLPSAWTDFVTR